MTLYSVIDVTATSFFVLRSVIFFEVLATSVFEMRATSFPVLRALFALMIGGFSRFGIRRILTFMMQNRREYDWR